MAFARMKLFAYLALVVTSVVKASPMGVEERAPAVVCKKKFAGTLSTMQMVVAEGPELGKCGEGTELGSLSIHPTQNMR